MCVCVGVCDVMCVRVCTCTCTCILTVVRCSCGCFDVVCLTEKSFIVQSEFFSGRQLALAGVAGEAGQVVEMVPRLTNPVRGTQLAIALGTLDRHRPAIVRR